MPKMPDRPFPAPEMCCSVRPPAVLNNNPRQIGEEGRIRVGLVVHHAALPMGFKDTHFAEVMQLPLQA